MLEGPQPERPKTHKGVLRLSNAKYFWQSTLQCDRGLLLLETVALEYHNTLVFSPLTPAERIKRDSRIEDLRVQVRTLSDAGVGERMRDKVSP